MKQNFGYIHVLRVVATLAIILLHAATGGIFEQYSKIGGVIACTSIIYKHTMEWAVPAFVLISGAIFLSPHKNIGYNILFSKYVRRIVLALVVFGLPMTLSENLLEMGVHQPLLLLFTSVKEWVCGCSWAHLWYLYMLIGLYLVTPIVKQFLNNATDSDIRIALVVMFFASSLLPVMKSYGVHIEGYMIIQTPFIFIYMLGYYLQWRTDDAVLKRYTSLTVMIFLLALVSIVARVCCGVRIYGYIDPACIFMAASLFVLLKQNNASSLIAQRLSPYCFCVYLIHTVFINLSYKILHITPVGVMGDASCAITIPMFSVVFALLSFVAAYVLMKVPILKKYVL